MWPNHAEADPHQRRMFCSVPVRGQTSLFDKLTAAGIGRSRNTHQMAESMAVHLYPSSYRCDCGHESHFTENTVRELERLSRRKRQVLGDSERPEHDIDFESGRAVAVICPELGRRHITDTE